MEREYTGTICWCYGEKRWDDRRGDYAVSGCKDEEIKISAPSNNEAYRSAMETARQKINESELPGRPSLGIISVNLVNLISSEGKVNLRGKKTYCERPVFNRVVLIL